MKSESRMVKEREKTVEATLTIVELNFAPRCKCQFLFNGFRIQMTVKDDALMKKIEEGERFGKGDAIRVMMKIVQRYNPIYKGYETSHTK